MFSITVKAGWYDMMLHGYKTEEYREIKQYNTIRFKKLFGCEQMSQDEFIKAIKSDNSGKYQGEAILRRGSNSRGKQAIVHFTLKAQQGNPIWGAENGVEYYTLLIDRITEIA